MWNNPLWIITLFIFAAIFNLAISFMMFYLRFKGRSENYTKSQLWALSRNIFSLTGLTMKNAWI